LLFSYCAFNPKVKESILPLNRKQRRGFAGIADANIL
jgi:hypothetical protein